MVKGTKSSLSFLEAKPGDSSRAVSERAEIKLKRCLGWCKVCYFICFVVKGQARDLQHIQVLHDRKHGLFMLFMIRIRRIDDMDQEVYILTFFQGRLKA